MAYCCICEKPIPSGREYFFRDQPAHEGCIIGLTATCDCCHIDHFKSEMLHIENTGGWICHGCYTAGKSPGEQIADFVAHQFDDALVGNDGVLFDALFMHMHATGERNIDRAFRAVLGKHRKIVGEAVAERRGGGVGLFLKVTLGTLVKVLAAVVMGMAAGKSGGWRHRSRNYSGYRRGGWKR